MYMYSSTFTNQLELFEVSLPFGGKLNSNNRWIKMAAQVDWEKFEKFTPKHLPQLVDLAKTHDW